MVSPKDKAKEFILKFLEIWDNVDTHQSIVQEAISSADYLVDKIMDSMDGDDSYREYWHDVKYQLTQWQ